MKWNLNSALGIAIAALLLISTDDANAQTQWNSYSTQFSQSDYASNPVAPSYVPDIQNSSVTVVSGSPSWNPVQSQTTQPQIKNSNSLHQRNAIQWGTTNQYQNSAIEYQSNGVQHQSSAIPYQSNAIGHQSNIVQHQTEASSYAPSPPAYYSPPASAIACQANS